MLHHPAEITKPDGDPYSVYTPYKNSFYTLPLPTPADCLPYPDRLPPLPEGITSDKLPEANPLPGFPATTQEAHRRLQNFID
jgi:deoxyribodipyrimidine photolyase